MPNQLLYLHGFISSPMSLKARQTQEYFALYHPEVTFICPQLDNYPARAIRQIEQTVQASRSEGKLGIIGSSLGGFYGTWAAWRYQCPAVLVNPAVRPDRLLSAYMGKHVHPYTQIPFELTPEHMQELKALELIQPCDELSLWVMLQTGDETLDHRQAEQKYQGCKMTVEPGGDHSFQGYDRYLEEIYAFLF